MAPSRLKIGIAVKAGTGGRKRHDITRLRRRSGHLYGLRHVRRPQNHKPAFGKAGVRLHRIFDFLRGGSRKDECFHMSDQLRRQRRKADAFVRAACNNDELLVKRPQPCDDARGAGGDGIVEPLHAVQRAHRLGAPRPQSFWRRLPWWRPPPYPTRL